VNRQRLIPLTGAFNFRDLGGYPAADGRTTRWDRLFRSDTLHELSPSDVELLLSMGVTTIIDLRTGRELERTGRGPLGDHPISYHHLSVIREASRSGAGPDGTDGGEGEAMAAPEPAGEELSERYLWYLEEGAGSLVTALSVLAEPDSYPAVFHCAAGKDRTGVLAALVLDILGVADEVIVADYLITAGRMPMILERYHTDPAFAERMASVPASRFSVEAGTMQRFLDGLHHRYGGARGWAISAGVPPEALDRLVDLLLERPG
jgi:hypothetical protein